MRRGEEEAADPERDNRQSKVDWHLQPPGLQETRRDSFDGTNYCRAEGKRQNDEAFMACDAHLNPSTQGGGQAPESISVGKMIFSRQLLKLHFGSWLFQCPSTAVSDHELCALEATGSFLVHRSDGHPYTTLVARQFNRLTKILSVESSTTRADSSLSCWSVLAFIITYSSQAPKGLTIIPSFS